MPVVNAVNCRSFPKRRVAALCGAALWNTFVKYAEFRNCLESAACVFQDVEDNLVGLVHRRVNLVRVYICRWTLIKLFVARVPVELDNG